MRTNRKSMSIFFFALACYAAVFMVAASPSSLVAHQRKAKARVEKRPFGKLADGSAVDLYTLTNRNGLRVEISNYGAAVVALYVPDARGQMADVVLGYEDASGYENDTFYMGTVVGRYANRIAGGKFKLKGVEYKLAQNNGPNHLHGGLRGFNKVLWQAREVRRREGPALELSYLSRDGEEGYPGNLRATTTYILTDANELRIEYRATTDKETIVNLTNHSYFNLAGAGAGSILQHELRLNAARFTPVDETSIPTGELKLVKGTPFDFTRATLIGKRIEEQDDQLLKGRGYDHNYVLNRKGKALQFAAEVYEPTSGRVMQVWTTEPGLQLYTANYLENARGKAGKVYNRREGFCLEAEHFPDSPNQHAFLSPVLRPNGRYNQTTVYKFMVRGAKEKP